MKHEFLQAERASQPRFPSDCKKTAIVELMDRTRVAVGRTDDCCVDRLPVVSKLASDSERNNLSPKLQV